MDGPQRERREVEWCAYRGCAQVSEEEEVEGGGGVLDAWCLWEIKMEM